MGMIRLIRAITERKRIEKILRSLHSITASQDLGYEEKLVALLETGCDQFNLPIGILSHVKGKNYEVVRAVTPNNSIKPGDVFNLGNTYCKETLQANGPIGFEHAGTSEWKYHPCYHEFKLEAYLGIPVVAGNEVYGTLNFSSPQPYKVHFTSTDKGILKLMAQWVGAEITRRQAEAALHESQRTLATLMGNLPGMAYRCRNDRNWTMEFVSDGCIKLTGYQPGELIQNAKLAFADLIHPEDKDTVWVEIQRAVQNGEPFQLTYRIQTASGEEKWLWEQGCGVYSSPKELQALEGFVTDITKRKQADHELKRYRDHLEELVAERTAKLEAAQEELIRSERLATLGQLTATVGHELRNPLGGVRNSLAAIKLLIGAEDARLNNAFAIADRGITRCDNIIAELLDFTRLRALERRPTAVDYWLEDVLDEYALAPDISLRRELKASVEIAFDRDRFRRAVLNVLDNARQGEAETATEGREQLLTVGSRVRDERLEVMIADTGPGIPADELEKIFEPLYSTKSFGVGLGLPIVKQIMEQHGGGIEIASEMGRGTQVVLWLPLGGEAPGNGS